MTQTIVSSHSHRVRIAPQRRTVVIGERCNTLGYKKVRETVMRGEWDEVVRRAKDQIQSTDRQCPAYRFRGDIT